MISIRKYYYNYILLIINKEFDIIHAFILPKFHFFLQKNIKKESFFYFGGYNFLSKKKVVVDGRNTSYNFLSLNFLNYP
jgi:hypothetical protein